MRIIIPSIQVPFISGGSILMTNGLANALRESGHEVEIITIPFKFFPESDVEALMDFWLTQDFNSFNGYEIDKVIVLQFPAYYVRHRDKTIWLMHQHRAVYDAYEEEKATLEVKHLRDKIRLCDTEEISKIGTIYSMSQNVSNRLKRYNGLNSTPLYHPPFGEHHFYCKEPYDYIFYPSRHEPHKRQDLLIRAMKYTQTPVKAILAGIGGQTSRYQELIEDLGLKEKVRLIGQITGQEKYTYYARSLAVFFGPHDEDYGYVTLEAMLSCKPILTCIDSGGPLEFVIDQENGFIVKPNPEFIAQKIDWFFHNKQKAKEMGQVGLETYRKMNVSWYDVVSKLL